MNHVSIFNINQAKHTSLATLGTACFVCQKIPGELLRCGQCKRISYCSAECQTADSEGHDKICLALQLIPSSTPSYLRRMIFESGNTPYDLEPEISWLYSSEKTLLEEMVGKVNMEHCSFHSDLLLYEPRCAVCLRSADDMRDLYDPEYSSLLHCPDCRAAFACGEEHRAQYLDEHSRELEDGESFTECELNKRAYEHSLEIVTRGWTKGETFFYPMRLKTEYTPLPSSWEEWFADPSNLCPPNSSPVLNRIRTKQLSIPMTILYGMELFDKAAGDLPLLTSRTELEIAVIGPMEYELKYGGLACFEEILHALPTLRRLTVRFVGPSIAYGILGPEGFNREAVYWERCALCKEKGVEFVHSIHPQLFHDYAKKPKWVTLEEGEEAPAFQWPDLAVAFDTGMGLNYYKRSEWSPTLEALAEHGVPTLCTAYLKREAEEDTDYLDMHRCNIVIERHKNPWRSELLTKMVFMRKHYFTYNGFIQGFRGFRESDEGFEVIERPPTPVFTEEFLSNMMKVMQAFMEP
ncbi:hypothetical protein SCHPADRAFT_942087 [Schizopora paradoxa]|uniref:MYND-type domain-containing protein n=1 Tax=Schizopora paradoxa TaxID=27342 RepID=A0A0H2RPH1_9AGAM|nr:hypothetical protein SCHPADRAFT_942087 [Schizopora paradoxa]